MAHFEMTTRCDGGVRVIEVRGEVDLAVRKAFNDAVTAVTRRSIRRIVIDLSAATFVDSTGLNALVRAHQRAEAGGLSLEVVYGSGNVARALEISGLDQLLDVRPSGRQPDVSASDAWS